VDVNLVIEFAGGTLLRYACGLPLWTGDGPRLNDGFMEREAKGNLGRRKRLRRTVAEKRRIVELSLQPGLSVAGVAQAEGINANQIFTWRREYSSGQLVEPEETATSLLPVVMASGRAEADAELVATVSPVLSIPLGAIRIEFRGRASITVEHGADSALLRTILESLRR
jgi:transposase